MIRLQNQVREKKPHVREAGGLILDCFFLSLLQPVTFSLALCALSLIEAQKPEEEIEVQIELHPKVICETKRYTTATELLPIDTVGFNHPPKKQLENPIV